MLRIQEVEVVVSVGIFDSVFLAVTISRKKDNSAKYSQVGNFVPAQLERVILSLFRVQRR